MSVILQKIKKTLGFGKAYVPRTCYTCRYFEKLLADDGVEDWWCNWFDDEPESVGFCKASEGCEQWEEAEG